MSGTMRSVIFNAYGSVDVLDVVERPLPSVGPDDVLVRVRAAAANPKDTFIRKGRFKRLTGNTFPQTLGSDYAGDVLEVGANVAHVQPGDAVWGAINGWKGGAHATHVLVKGAQLAHKPESLSYGEATAIPLAAQTALQSLRDLGNIQAKNHVLINGASGGVGTFAVQIARIYHAQITATCSARNVVLVTDLGADSVIDYTQVDILKSGLSLDIFFDVFGNYSYGQVKHLLKRGGIYVTTVPNIRNFRQSAVRRILPGQSAYVVVVDSNTRDLNTLRQWVEDGKLRPVIDKVYPLDAIKSVHEHIQTKRTRGKVVITMPDE